MTRPILMSLTHAALPQDVYFNSPGKLGPGLKDVPKFADMMITNILDKLVWPRLAMLRLGWLSHLFYNVFGKLGLVGHPKDD